MPMASRMPGMARNTSTKRIRKASTCRRQPPASAPITPPSSTAMTTEQKPDHQAETRAVEDTAELVAALDVRPHEMGKAGRLQAVGERAGIGRIGRQ